MLAHRGNHMVAFFEQAVNRNIQALRRIGGKGNLSRIFYSEGLRQKKPRVKNHPGRIQSRAVGAPEFPICCMAAVMALSISGGFSQWLPHCQNKSWFYKLSCLCHSLCDHIHVCHFTYRQLVRKSVIIQTNSRR